MERGKSFGTGPQGTDKHSFLHIGAVTKNTEGGEVVGNVQCFGEAILWSQTWRGTRASRSNEKTVDLLIVEELADDKGEVPDCL